MHFKGGDALGDFFENTWMKPNEYVAFHQNTAVHSKWSVLVHGTAAGKTLDGCIFNLDYLVEVGEPRHALGCSAKVSIEVSLIRLMCDRYHTLLARSLRGMAYMTRSAWPSSADYPQ